MEIDFTQWGNVFGGLVAGVSVAAGAAIAVVGKLRKQIADSKLELAESRAAQGAADADSKVYTRITQELDRQADRLRELDTELVAVRLVLAQERERNHQLELRLAQLDGFIRSKGWEPPSVTWSVPQASAADPAGSPAAGVL